MKWWVTRSGQSPVGPVSTELLLEGIAESLVPLDSLVAELGGATWKPIGEVLPFSEAIKEARAQGKQPASNEFDSPDEKTTVDVPPVPEDLDDPMDTTLVDLIPLGARPPAAKP